MWSILRTLTKFWVSGHLKIRWVLDGYLGRFWGGSGGASWDPKSIKLALRGQHVRKKVFFVIFFGWSKQQVNSRSQKESIPLIDRPKLVPWGEGREGENTGQVCGLRTSKPHQPMRAGGIKTMPA